jgi:hypothetical protein
MASTSGLSARGYTGDFGLAVVLDRHQKAIVALLRVRLTGTWHAIFGRLGPHLVGSGNHERVNNSA